MKATASSALRSVQVFGSSARRDGKPGPSLCHPASQITWQGFSGCFSLFLKGSNAPGHRGADLEGPWSSRRGAWGDTTKAQSRAQRWPWPGAGPGCRAEPAGRLRWMSLSDVRFTARRLGSVFFPLACERKGAKRTHSCCSARGACFCCTKSSERALKRDPGSSGSAGSQLPATFPPTQVTLWHLVTPQMPPARVCKHCRVSSPQAGAVVLLPSLLRAILFLIKPTDWLWEKAGSFFFVMLSS